MAAYSAEGAGKLRAVEFDAAALAKRALPYERLDQIVVDILLGAR